MAVNKSKQFFESLDGALKNEKSKQSISQMKRRIIEPEPLCRSRPIGQFPTWAFV